MQERLVLDTQHYCDVNPVAAPAGQIDDKIFGGQSKNTE